MHAHAQTQPGALANEHKHTHARAHTHTHTHPHTTSSCDADECDALLSLAPPLSLLELDGNLLATLPEGVFSGLLSLRSLVCRRE